MSTLFILGNGFDVNCGMKTRYKDVYDGYIAEESRTENIKRFKGNISADLENWGDFEMAMAKYASMLEGENDFLECVRDFAKYMEKWLLEEQNSFKKILTDTEMCNAVVNEFRNSITSFYTGISHNVERTMENRNAGYPLNHNFITFNYTDVLESIWNEYSDKYGVGKRQVVHIHGILGDDPVFGVDSVEQIKADFSISRRGKRGFVKPIFNAEYDSVRVEQAKEYIYTANTICVFGMSLGESDLTWRNEIIRWLRDDANHHLFIYRFNLSNTTYITVSDKMDIEEAEKESLLAEWDFNLDDDILDQIHIPCGKNIFNIQKVIELIEKEKLEKRKAELKEKIEQGMKFVEQHSEEMVV